MANFFAELKRRHIYRVAAAYAVVAWVVLQLVNNVAPGLNLPNWAVTLTIVFLAAGFPIALIFAWIHQLASTDGATARATTGKLDWVLIGALVVVIALVSYQQLAPTQATRTPQQATTAPSAANVAGISVAVLPFVNLSSDKEQEFFSDGMTEEITSALAKVSGLNVVARTSAFEFKGQNRNIQAIGLSLHATHVIEGSVRKAGDRVRITAQLIRADNGLHLWTENYDRELKDVFAVQEDIAEAIATSLRVPLGLKPGETLVSNRTSDIDLYQQYLRARTLYRVRELDQAIALLETAVARDRNYAPAWGLLAQTYVQATPRADSVQVAQSFDKAEKAAREAIRLDSQNANAYGALADIQYRRGNWAAAEDLYRQALARDPNETDVLNRYGTWLAAVGRNKESLSVSQKVLAREPLVSNYKTSLANAMQRLGQYKASIPILQSVSADEANILRNSALARAAAVEGRYAEAADTLLAITRTIDRQLVENAARLLRSAPAKAVEPLPDLGGTSVAFVYAYVGAADRILEGYEQEVENRYINAFGDLWRLEQAPLRKTERFKAFARKAGLVDYWRARGWPDLCRPMGADDFVCD